MTRVEELERIIAELYQVIGILADRGHVFDLPQVQRALDNAANAKLIHDNVLPFALDE
jgi:hypothetical protein